MENTGAFTATMFLAGHNPPSYPISRSPFPRITRVARLTIGTFVTLDRNGTVRLDLGFTSSTYTVVSVVSSAGWLGLRYAGPPTITNCTFISPLMFSARPIRVV